MSKKFYFTFGSSNKFPYQNTYLVVVARDKSSAYEGFRIKYPDRDSKHPCLNCSGVYDEQTWDKYVRKYYSDKKPVDIIFAPNCYGKAKDNYDDIYIYVPVPDENGYIIYISEGTGDNLLFEDIEEGYVDYINYEIYMFGNGICEDDGGMIMLRELFRDKYSCTADCIPDVLEFTHDTKLINCQILN